MSKEDWESLGKALAKFSPLSVIYWFLCRKGVIPKEYSLPIALIGGYILGFATALVEDWFNRRFRNGQ